MKHMNASREVKEVVLCYNLPSICLRGILLLLKEMQIRMTSITKAAIGTTTAIITVRDVLLFPAKTELYSDSNISRIEDNYFLTNNKQITGCKKRLSSKKCCNFVCDIS